MEVVEAMLLSLLVVAVVAGLVFDVVAVVAAAAGVVATVEVWPYVQEGAMAAVSMAEQWLVGVVGVAARCAQRLHFVS